MKKSEEDGLYSEDDLIPLSALQHLLFCARQCALIHVEQTWVENLYTAEGRILHDRVDAEKRIVRGEIRVEFGMALKSRRLGLIGKADVVEFHLKGEGATPEEAPGAAAQPGNGRGNGVKPSWTPFPVEYKRGRPKKDFSDKVQLCAQALCLEEMLDVKIPAGALFYGKTRRRLDVVFDEELGRRTRDAARRVHELLDDARTPRPRYTKKCDKCSFVELCLPRTLERNRSVKRYLEEVVGES
ncbi:MAG: CRISPR-associated protein Cas4 [Desulfobacterales bacterium]|nr:CRISPR-associated protein Cas4 [Desulfobacterales bacterium]